MYLGSYYVKLLSHGSHCM